MMDFATFKVKDKSVGTSPVFHDGQALVNFAAQHFRINILAQENGFQDLTKFRQNLVSKMLQVAACGAAQNSFGFCGPRHNAVA